MRTKNQLANCVTGLRIIASIYFVVLIEDYFRTDNMKLLWVVVGFLVVILSDFFDGKIARALNIVSKFGAMFDMFADLVFVIILHLQLYLHNKVSIFFLFLITEKVANYFVTSKVIQNQKKSEFVFIKDPVGKYVAASYFFVPMILILIDAYFQHFQWAGNVIVFIIAGAGVYSSIYRWKAIFKLKH